MPGCWLQKGARRGIVLESLSVFEECLFRALQTVGGAGALRFDFDAAYHLEDSSIGPLCMASIRSKLAGSGSFGSVHRARAKNSKGEKAKRSLDHKRWQERSGEPLAVKVLDGHAFKTVGSLVETPEKQLLRAQSIPSPKSCQQPSDFHVMIWAGVLRCTSC